MFRNHSSANGILMLVHTNETNELVNMKTIKHQDTVNKMDSNRGGKC